MQEMPTERIHEEMSRVISHANGLATVARAVDALNLSLAHHAAWTDERFDKVEERFNRIDERFVQVDQRFDRLELKVANLEHKVDNGFAETKAHFARLEAKVDAGYLEMAGMINHLTARVEEVINVAERRERRIDEIDE